MALAREGLGCVSVVGVDHGPWPGGGVEGHSAGKLENVVLDIGMMENGSVVPVVASSSFWGRSV